VTRDASADPGGIAYAIKWWTRDRVMRYREPPATLPQGELMIDSMHTTPIPDPLADPTRDPEGDPLAPPSPGHHNDEPQRPDGPPDKDPV
jgi:hypothetical protein